MKQRNLLSASEVKELHQNLDSRMEKVGIESQPEVVLRLLDLSTRRDAQLLDYAKVIKADHAISGRVLKLSNSALFAQRTPVTNLERACLLLGIERLKAVSLGFHLSRAASAGGEKEISRQVWGQSVFRACMAAEAARQIAPSLVAEAFVVGLMMDAGIPLMRRLLGDSYAATFAECAAPTALYRREFDTLPFTHVDVVTTLVRKWRFPELLARPLELHHTRPAETAKDDPVSRLHRIAYVVGSLALEQSDPGHASLMHAAQAGGIVTAQRVLRVNDEEMAKVVQGAVNEYQVLIDVFAEVASAVGNLEELAGRIQTGLINALDRGVVESLAKEAAPTSNRLVVRGQFIEIVREPDGALVAFVSDATGQRVVSHRLSRSGETPQSLCDALGLESPGGDDATRIAERLKLLAA